MLGIISNLHFHHSVEEGTKVSYQISRVGLVEVFNKLKKLLNLIKFTSLHIHKKVLIVSLRIK